MTKKLLFALALTIGLLIGLRFFWKPSSTSPFPVPNAQTNNSEPITSPSFSPSPIVSSPRFTEIRLDNQKLSVELATTTEEKKQGLSGRTGIGADGMLFTMDPAQVAVFWMKDMRFPIDILWIKDGKVTGFVENAPTPAEGTVDEKLPTYSSKTSIDSVLELPAGYVKQYGVHVESILVFVHFR